MSADTEKARSARTTSRGADAPAGVDAEDASTVRGPDDIGELFSNVVEEMSTGRDEPRRPDATRRSGPTRRRAARRSGSKPDPDPRP
jgi:hypothetical protein